MMRAIATMVLAVMLAACADQPARDDDLEKRLAEKEEQDRREQERLCRIYAETNRYDPKCRYYPQPPPPPPERGVPVPPPPSVPLPGR